MPLLRRESVERNLGDFDFSNRRELPPGGNARVFVVKLHGEDVVLKVPHAIGSSDNEISNYAGIAHRNIVTFFGSVHYDNRTCVVLELAPKGSVRDLIKSGDLTLLRTSRKQWMLETARAVKYLHFDAPTKIVHGDLKGSNILVFDTPDGGTVAKISDFGQARELFATSSAKTWGTFLWTAPEVLAENVQSLKSDVWSYATTVVELFSEVVPYNHRHQKEPQKIKEVLNQVEKKELDPLSGLQVTWPEGLLSLLQDCFKKKYESRPSMEEVLRDLSGDDVAPNRTHSLRLSVWNPDGKNDSATVQVKAEKNFGEAITLVGEFLTTVPVGDTSVWFCNEFEFSRGRERRKSILCYDTERSRVLRVDQEDGQEVDAGSVTLSIRRFLNVHSTLPQSPCFAPHVIIWNDTELFQVTLQRKLEAAPRDALLLPKFVTFLFGIKCGKEQPKFFWRLCTDKPEAEYLSTDGKVFVGRKAIDDSRDRSHFTVFLRDGDRPPFICLPEGRYLEVFHRLGADVDVAANGSLKATLAPFLADLERWVTTVKASDVHKKISAAARRQ